MSNSSKETNKLQPECTKKLCSNFHVFCVVCKRAKMADYRIGDYYEPTDEALDIVDEDSKREREIRKMSIKDSQGESLESKAKTTKQILDILGLLLTEDYQGYITDMKTEESK
jgi:hypothetical protein